MTAQQIRQTFLDYFIAKGHRQWPSSSLVPDNDASVLLTTAGMQQFKPYFLGEKDPTKDFGARRTTTVQKCFRTSDIDEVGDTSHLTFFEMLGNFSFGDYWKTESIDFAWELLTKKFHLNPHRLWVTVFAGDGSVPRDTEAEKAWLKHVPAERIVACGAKDNFWGPPGKTGSCGPSSEIHWQIVDQPKGKPNSSDEFVELWNLVFTEYFKNNAGELAPLPSKNIDTGMGLERLAMVIKKADHVYETDSYEPILKSIRQIEAFGQSDEATVQARRERIVADHLRAAVFLLADGVEFSNKDQGYILRRVTRRAADQFLLSEFSLDSVVDTIISHFSTAYPELQKAANSVKEKLHAELDQYRKVLSVDVGAVVKKMRKESGESVQEMPTGPGTILLTPDETFTLYSTHGVSLDRLARLGFGFERQAVEERIQMHQELSRAGAEKKFGGHGLSADNLEKSDMSDKDKDRVTRLPTATHLLHASLRQILGPEVKQMGSDITPERLRFDFSFHRKLTDEEKLTVEALVNEKIHENITVTHANLPFQAAIDAGALAFFKEKYPAVVSVYSIGDFSKELCGGPHVDRTGTIGQFKLASEQSVGSGVRRIKGEVV